MTRRRIIIAAIVAAIIVVLILTRGFGLWGGGNGDRLTLYGNVDIREVDLGFRVGGRIAVMPVEEGARVAGGTVLARLDPRPLGDLLASAKARVGVATAELDRMLSGNRSQDIAQAAAAVAERQAALAKAREDFERRKSLIATGAISQAVFDATRAQYLAARAQVDAAKQALSLQRAGARSEDIAAARAQRASAAAERDRAATDLADATIISPTSGTILTRAREPGAIVQPGETVFTLAIARPLRVRAYIAESDLGRISPGMNVLVTTDSSSRTYHGTIGFISPTAEFTPKSVQTENLRTDLVYRVRVVVTDADDGLRQGQPVTVAVPAARPPAN